MNEKYLEMIKIINKSITSFSKNLSPSIKIDKLGKDVDNKKKYTNIVNTPSGEQLWPNSNEAGVYFLFGKNKTTGEAGLYIGKASLSSKIGNRLWVHLKPHRDSNHYYMNDNNGKQFILELVSSISLEKINKIFLGPSMEEFLIEDLKGKICLLNAKGNK